MEMLTNDDMLFYTEHVIKFNENDLDQFYEKVYQDRNRPDTMQPQRHTISDMGNG